MADSNFVVKNGLTVNGSFTANSTLFALGSVSANSTTINVSTATINSTIYTGTANNANYLGGTIASAFVNTSGAYTITGIHTHQVNVHTGNAAVNTQISNNTVLITNATSTTAVGLTDIRVGNTTTNVIIANTVSSFGGNVSITGVANVTGNVTLGASAFFVGNGVSITTVNATSVNTGTLPWAQAPTNTVNTTGTFTITGIRTHQANLHVGNSTVNSQFSNGQINDRKGDVRAIPSNFQGSIGYTLVANDVGKSIITNSTGPITVPGGVFNAGDAITIFNNDGGSSVSVLQGTNVTMYLAGVANTGTRTLAKVGVATVLCFASNTFVISGAGLS